MADVNYFDNFETLWGTNGGIEAIDVAQYEQGWAYIGATPPSVEQFNRVQQINDQKAAWLFKQIKELADEGGYALSADMVDALTKGIAATMQAGKGVVGIDTGAANAYVVDYVPAVPALVDGMALWFKVKTANTGASTLNVNGLGARQIVGMGHSPLQGGEMVANGKALVVWKADANAYVLVASSGGGSQVAPATRNMHAVQFGQLPAVVGSMRNGRMVISAASSSATFTADEIVVRSALGGLAYNVVNVNETINLAATGPGGMDTGAAPANGFVAIYAIYNPTTGAKALLGQDATSVTRGEVYSGANLPAGYTASALVSVRATNGSGQFAPGVQHGRSVSFPPISILATTTTSASYTAVSAANAAPRNATSCRGGFLAQASQVTGINAGIAGDGNGAGGYEHGNASATVYVTATFDVEMAAPQTVYRKLTAAAGTINQNIILNGYRF